MGKGVNAACRQRGNGRSGVPLLERKRSASAPGRERAQRSQPFPTRTCPRKTAGIGVLIGAAVVGVATRRAATSDPKRRLRRERLSEESRAVSPWMGLPPRRIRTEGGASERGVWGENQGGGNGGATPAPPRLHPPASGGLGGIPSGARPHRAWAHCALIHQPALFCPRNIPRRSDERGSVARSRKCDRFVGAINCSAVFVTTVLARFVRSRVRPYKRPQAGSIRRVQLVELARRMPGRKDSD